MLSATELARSHQESQRGFYRALATGSRGARLLELAGGVQATIAPIREWFSIFNSVLYLDAAALLAAHSELAGAYEAAGVRAWTVWVPPQDEATGEALASLGHKLDSTPMRMWAAIDAIDLEPRRTLDLDPEPSWQTVARVNDRAHDVLEDWSMAAVFERMEDPVSHLYVAREAGEPVAALIAREHERDCYFWFVAADPGAQRKGFGSELMRTALRAARDRGCTSTSLESTKVAERMYRALSYGATGRFGLWER